MSLSVEVPRGVFLLYVIRFQGKARCAVRSRRETVRAAPVWVDYFFLTTRFRDLDITSAISRSLFSLSSSDNARYLTRTLYPRMVLLVALERASSSSRK